MYDDVYDCYVCEVNLDEDEMENFLRGSDFECHYFSAYDEYKIVRKQNWRIYKLYKQNMMKISGGRIIPAAWCYKKEAVPLLWDSLKD